MDAVEGLTEVLDVSEDEPRTYNHMSPVGMGCITISTWTYTPGNQIFCTSVEFRGFGVRFGHPQDLQKSSEKEYGGGGGGLYEART